MTKSGFDLDEIEQLLAAATPDPAPRSLRELDERGYARRAFGNAMIEAAPAMIARLRYLETENALMADNGCHLEAVISELRAENARLKEDVRRQTSLAQDHFRNATRLAARAALGEPQ